MTKNQRLLTSMNVKGAHGEAPLERKEPTETLKWGRRELIPDLKDSFRSYVYVNEKHTICEGEVGGGLKSTVELRQQRRSSLFLLYCPIRGLVKTDSPHP